MRLIKNKKRRDPRYFLHEQQESLPDYETEPIYDHYETYLELDDSVVDASIQKLSGLDRSRSCEIEKEFAAEAWSEHDRLEESLDILRGYSGGQGTGEIQNICMSINSSKEAIGGMLFSYVIATVACLGSELVGLTPEHTLKNARRNLLLVQSIWENVVGLHSQAVELGCSRTR